MVRDTFSLFLAFIRNNWTLILVSTIGLTLTLTTVSQTSVVVYSSQKNLFEDFLSSSTYTYGSSDFDIEISERLQNADEEMIQSVTQRAVNNSQNLGQRAAQKLELSNFIKREIWHLSIRTLMFFQEPGLSEWSHDFVYIDTLDNDTLNFCQAFLTSGKMPQKSNETVFIVEKTLSDHYNIQVGDEVLLSSTSLLQGVQRGQNATAVITGIVEYSYTERWQSASKERNSFWDHFNWIDSSVFLTGWSNFIDFAATIYKNETIGFSIHELINVDLTQLDAFNLEAEETRLKRFKNQLEVECSALGHDYFDVEDNIVRRIPSFDLRFSGTINLMWLFSLSTLTATLFLGTFTLNLSQRRKKQQINTLRTRGVSSRQIFVVLLGESFIILIFSVGLGTIVGILFAFVSLQTKEFLDFTGESIPLYLPPPLIPIVLIFGIIFGLFLNLLSFFRLNKLDIDDSVTSQDKRKPLWKKFYLDGTMLFVGLLGIFSLILFSNLVTIPVSEMQIIYSLVSFILFFFGIPSPIFIAMGGAMLADRLLPVLLRVLARWLWQLEGGIIAFSFRNVLHRISHASRAVLLISIVIAFSIAFITIPYNNDINAIEDHYYNNLGADMVVDTVSSSFNYTLFNYLRNNLTGIASVSPITQASRPLSDGRLNILGVDINTYAQTTFFREDFLNPDVLSSLLRLDIGATVDALLQEDLFPDNPDLSTLLSKLQSDTTVLIQEDNLKIRGLNVGEKFPLIITIYNDDLEDYQNIRYDLDIAGTFKSWPLFIEYPVSHTPQDLYIISNLSTVLKYANADLFTIWKFNYLIRVHPGVSTIQLKEQIVNEMGMRIEIKCIEEFLEEYENSPKRNTILTTINGSVLILMTVALFTILMFGFSQLMERGKEIGVERALGMSLKQTSLLFVIEAMILILFGIIVGIILGILIGQIFLIATMLAQTLLFPPLVIRYPWDLFTGITVLIMIIGVISSSIPAFLASRIKIGNILRGE
ncbi:MAG: FtsX-like permease family protein [Promethearchaeota archaeon]